MLVKKEVSRLILRLNTRGTIETKISADREY